MNAAELIQHFESQFEKTLDEYQEQDPTCAYAAGMLLILSAIKRFDGPTIPFQVSCMHVALRRVGAKRGWGVQKTGEYGE